MESDLFQYPAIDPSGALELMCVACSKTFFTIEPFSVDLENPPENLEATGNSERFMAQALLHIGTTHRFSTQTIDALADYYLAVLESPLSFLVVATYRQRKGRISVDQFGISSFQLPKK